MTSALLRTLIAGRSSGVPASAFPTSWGLSRYVSNPVIDVANNPNETTEQYVPAPIQLANGDIWCYVKGGSTIYAWKSTDAGVTFSLQNSNNPVIGHGAGGSWDANFVVEPAAVYDVDTDTIHLWYGGRDASSSHWAWGHATAPGSTPTVFTKDPANPILTAATVSTALGGSAVTDLKISDVILIGSTYHFYGYAEYNSIYRLIHASGSTWNNPSGTSILLSAGATTVVETPTVFRPPGLVTPAYGMLYALGGAQPNPRTIRAATSVDGVTWDFSSTADVVSPTGSGWEQDEAYSGSVLKVSSAPYLLPVVDGSNRWKLYYSGLGGAKANVGLAYLTPV